MAEHCDWSTKYTDEEVAAMTDYDYGYLLDMMYYKLERMNVFFNSKYVHIVGAKKVAWHVFFLYLERRMKNWWD